MFSHLRSLAIEQLNTLDEQIRIVVVHPNYNQQRIILFELYKANIVYVRFEDKKLNQSQVEAAFEAALENQQDHLKPGQPVIFLLDECDRAQPKALSRQVGEIIQRFEGSRVFLFSRELPHHIITDDKLRCQTTFIPHDPSYMLWDYAQREPEPILLEVRAFGEGHVYLNGKRIEDWDGVLPRSLFFYLIDRGMTTRNDIFETFWPGLPTREATNVFHVTKRKVSEVLGLDLTTYYSSYYRISSDVQLSYDVILFSQMLQEAEVADDDDKADKLLTQAIGLYHGLFLQAMDMEWAQKRRRELAQDYGDALISLAKIKERKGAKEDALGYYLRAITNNRHREDLTISIMQLYREQRRYTDAMSAYERLKNELALDLGVAPGHNVQLLAAEIQQEMLQAYTT